MQFNIIFIATALVASASLAIAGSITAFAGADCDGGQVASHSASSGECLTLGSASAKSISFSGLSNGIRFYKSGGPNDNCSGSPSLVLSGSSGCGTAPTGFNWESVFIQ